MRWRGRCHKVKGHKSSKKQTTIQRAEDFYETVKILEKKAENPDGSCIHTRRTILWIDRDNIVHQRSDRDSKTVHGTRKLHSILGVRRGEIKTRRLSCFCVECTHNNPDGCLNADYVDTCKAVPMKPLSFENVNDTKLMKY